MGRLSGNCLTRVRGMDEAMVSQVRRFNRTVTQRVGALDDAFLSRDRPLGQARLLWEIGPDSATSGSCGRGWTWTRGT